MNEISEAKKALNELTRFVDRGQLEVLSVSLRGEERHFFIDKICELRDLVARMPKTYEQEGRGDNAVIYLHYFIGSCDWYVMERDTEEEQLQAFGIADLGYGQEYGYISIEELLESGVELDFYYRPRTVAEQISERDRKEESI